MFVPATSPELRAQILAMMLGAPEATAAGAMAAMFDPVNQSDRTISAPALSVFAGNSNFTNTEATKELVPDWTQEKFAGTGHFLMMEDPARFNAALEPSSSSGRSSDHDHPPPCRPADRADARHAARSTSPTKRCPRSASTRCSPASWSRRRRSR